MDRMLGRVRRLRERHDVEVQAGREAFDEASTTRRACLVEHDVLDEILRVFPEEPRQTAITSGPRRVALVGKPNVGKSSLVSLLSLQELIRHVHLLLRFGMQVALFR